MAYDPDVKCDKLGDRSEAQVLLTARCSGPRKPC